MRAIDADALAEIIHGMYADGDDSNSYHVDVDGDTLIGKFAVIDTIFNMPTIQPEPHWIPVTERLPENNRNVLITSKGGVSTAWYNGSYFEKGASTHHRMMKTVTAWCELPEPYKGVTE